MKPFTVDLSLLHACYHGAQKAGCVYLYDAKPPVTADSSAVLQSDCSGMSRWLLARATQQGIIAAGFPDGSSNQHDWCRAQGLHSVAYSDLHYTVNDPGRLFIAFEDPHPIGHVWLIQAGDTIECHGPRGAHLGGRRWNDPVLVRIVSACFELPVQ